MAWARVQVGLGVIRNRGCGDWALVSFDVLV